MKASRNTLPFCFSMQLKSFNDSLDRYLREQLLERQAEFLSPENMLAYSHGMGRKTTSRHPKDQDSTFKSYSVESEASFSRVVNNDLSLISDLENTMINGILSQLMEAIDNEIKASTKRTGNIVYRKEGDDYSEAFLEMLKKIEFGIDQTGNVSIPQVHAPPEMARRISEDLSKQGPSFEAEVNRIKNEKIADALETEITRLDKFLTKKANQ